MLTKPSVFVFIFSLIIGVSFAEDKSPSKHETIIVTATRTKRDTFDLPYSANSIDREQLINQRMSRTFPEIFREEGVSVQKTANGQGSPFIRGFTGFRTLLMVDGIRLNNSTFRSGPNQYWATVDPLSLNSVEIVKGPASVLHGSDAIGGAVNALTISPYNGDKYLSGRFYTRLSSAENSNTERLEASGKIVDGTDYVVGFTRKEYGDVDAGGGTKDGSGHQNTTGYDEPRDFDIKVVSQLSDNAKLTFAHQHVFQDDVWRTHRTIYGKSWHGTTVGSDLARFFDQERDLSYGRIEFDKPSQNIEKLTFTLSHHLQNEVRERLRSNLRTELQGVRVQTWGLQGQVEHDIDNHYLTWGFDYYRDNVDSFFRDYNANGSLRTVRQAGPVADNSTYGLLGVFLQDEIESDDWTVIPGFRYTSVDVDADKVDAIPTDATPYARVSKTFETATGSLKVLHKTTDQLRTFVGVSQGFRAPNLSDYTRFDTARTNEIQTPAQCLNPEEFVAAEVGARYKNKIGSVEGAYFYTWMDDYIIRKPTGQTVNGSQEVKADNAGKGFVEGLELRMEYFATEEVTLFGDYYWNRGQVDNFTSSNINSKDERPISKLGANNGALGVRWEPSNWWIEGFGRFTRRQDKLAPGDVTDTSRIPPVDGTPGYNIYTIRGGWEMTETLNMTMAIENITDKAYRYHGSGQNEPGRNFILAFDAKF